MTAPYILPPATRRLTPPTVRSVARWRWLGRLLSLDAMTGQVGTLTRAATGTALDSLGGTITWPHSAARWEIRGGRGGLRMATDDLTWPCTFTPEAGTLLVDWTQLTALTNGMGVLYIGDDAQSGNRFSLRGGAGNTLVAELRIGGNTSTATLTGTVATNDAVVAVVQLDDDGTNQRVRIGAYVNGATVAFSSYGTAIARGTAWAAGAVVRANRIGSAGTQGSMWLADAAWFPGAPLSLTQVLERL